MQDVQQLITEHLAVWTGAIKKRAATGRGSNSKIELTGIKKLRELILELAVRGKLVPQDPNDEPASELLEKIRKEKQKLVEEKKIKSPRAYKVETKVSKSTSLPENWVWSHLHELTYMITDGAHHTPQYTKAGIPFLSVKDMSSGKLDFSNTKFISEEQHNELIQRCNPESGDLLLTKIGTTGVPVRINTERSFSIFVSVALIKFFDDYVDGDYLVHLISSPLVKKQSADGTQGVGNKNLVLKTIAAFEVAVPPLQEQKRIVAKIDELMVFCDKLEQQTEDSIDAHQTLVETLLNTLTSSENAEEFQRNWQLVSEHFTTLFTTEQSVEQLKQAILQLAVMGKLVPQDPNDESAKNTLEDIETEKKRLIDTKEIRKSVSKDEIVLENCDWKIPVNWKTVELQELFKFIDYRGKNPQKSNAGKRLITAKNIRNGFIKNEPTEYISEELYEEWMVRGFPKNNDILFVTEGHTMGFTALVDFPFEFAIAQRTICFQSFIELDSKFFLYVFMCSKFQKILQDNQTGSAAGGIKASKLKRVPIPFPPTNEQKRIVVKVEQLMSLCDQLKSSIQKSLTTKVELAEALVKQGLS